jgi:tetratricopeptide (TPR) repeat protein
VSLFGDTLQFPIFDDSTTAQLQDAARAAAARLERDPSAENFVWLGRRLAYLWRYERAIAVFTNGIRGFPNDAALYRHRGHRYITTRRFEDAIADLTIAAGLISGTDDRIEEDGAPNPYNRPRSTLHFNVWYHLGLAHYLVADFEPAIEGFRQALAVSKNDDSVVAAIDWLYMSLRRSGLHNEASLLLDVITPDMEILENNSYHNRLLMYKGLLSPDDLLDRADASDLELATQGYGVANWLLYTGDSAAARELLLKVVDGDYWPAFGYIAAEADLARSPE